MKFLKLTKGLVGIVDDEDFEKFGMHKWHASGRPGYPARRLKDHECPNASRKQVFLHRIIMNAAEDEEVDHINGNVRDNRRKNLRICTHAQNSYNRRMHTDNKSGFKGVYWQPAVNKWCSRIQYKGKGLILGYFTDPEEAARSYDEHAIKLHGDFARLNFPY